MPYSDIDRECTAITILTLGILAAFTKLLDIYCQLELARARGNL